MSQKTDLQATNADLQAILNLVNSLPDKVEAPTYETATVSINIMSIQSTATMLIVDSGTVSVTERDISDSMGTYDMPKILAGSLIYVQWIGKYVIDTVTGATVLFDGTNCSLFKVTGNTVDIKYRRNA